MISVEDAKSRIESGWAEVLRVWLDENANGVERGSITPLLEKLRSAEAFNDEQRAQAEQFAAKAAETPMER